MNKNPIQFAIMREDPSAEIRCIQRRGTQKVLLIASGGCTALTLKTLFPDLEVQLLDPNPAQLSLIRKKVEHLNDPSLSLDVLERKFNVETDAPGELNACGNFESLFRGLRDFISEFILPREDLRKAITRSWDPQFLEKVLFKNPYWEVAFDLWFHDSLLLKMFGPEALQYAVPGSYPRYFQVVFERGLTRPDAPRNSFLHHALLGQFLHSPADAVPLYLRQRNPTRPLVFAWQEGKLDAIPDLGEFDLISLSNIFDWSSPLEIQETTERLRRESRSGAQLILRQLNHTSDFQRLLSPEYTFDLVEGDRLLKEDQSLFYSKYNIGLRK